MIAEFCCFSVLFFFLRAQQSQYCCSFMLFWFLWQLQNPKSASIEKNLCQIVIMFFLLFFTGRTVLSFRSSFGIFICVVDQFLKIRQYIPGSHIWFYLSIYSSEHFLQIGSGFRTYLNDKFMFVVKADITKIQEFVELSQ